MGEQLAFTITGRDHLSEKLDVLARKVDKVSDRLTRLDHKRANPKIDIDVDRPLAKVDKFGNELPGLMASPLKAITGNVYTLGAAIVAALAAAPALAAVAATGIVTAFGGGIAAIGIMAAAQSKKVQDAFGHLKDDVGAKLKAMAAPFEPTLVHIADVAGKVFGTFSKPLEQAFAKIAPALSVFADQFGQALEALAPAIGPVTDAFTAILRQLGPQLPGLFKSLGDSIRNIAKVVEANAGTFASFIVGLAKIAPVALNVVAVLAKLFALEVEFAPKAAAAMLAFAEVILKATRFISTAILDNFGVIVEGAAKAFGWIPGVGGKLKGAAAAFDTFRDGVRHSLDGAIAKVESWRQAVANMPKKLKLEGDIRDLQGKIDAAKARLKTVPPSKQTAIRAEISQLQAKLREAKAALASLHDRTVTVTMRVQQLIATAPAKVRQHGGPLGAGQAAVVGERGPELFIPATAGMVIPNSRLGGGGGRASTTVTYTVNVYPPVAADKYAVGREVVEAIKAYERGNGARWRKP